MWWFIFFSAFALAVFFFIRRVRKDEEEVAKQLPVASPELQALLDSISADNGDDDLDNETWTPQREFIPSNPKPISATLRLSYLDASGNHTERNVDVKECDTTNAAGYLIGFCHMRRAIRTFRMDRIRQAIDAETGEVIANLADYAAKKYNESPAASLDLLLADSADALRCLFYIAKADGRFTKKEKEVFLAFCHESSGDTRLSMAQIESACRQLQIPTKQAYKLICGRLGTLLEQQRQRIITAAEAMIATERTVAPEETEALNYLKKRLTTDTA